MLETVLGWINHFGWFPVESTIFVGEFTTHVRTFFCGVVMFTRGPYMVVVGKHVCMFAFRGLVVETSTSRLTIKLLLPFQRQRSMEET